MAIARFEMPDGRIARFEVPEGTTPEQAQQQFQQMMESQQIPQQQGANLLAQQQQAMTEGVDQSSEQKPISGNALTLAAALASDPRSTIEPALTFGSSVIADPLSGLAGLVSAPFIGAEGAADVVEGTREFLTYRPRSGSGQVVNRISGEALAPVGQAIDTAARFAADPAAEKFGAGVGTAVYTAPFAALEALGLKGLRKARGARRVTGIPDDVAENLQRQGINLDNLSDADIKTLQDSVQADINQRASRFEELGIEPTVGDITQRTADKAQEARLLEVPNVEGREALINRRIQQSEGLRKNLEELQANLGEAESVGESAKAAAGSLKESLAQKKTDLYKRFAEESPELADIPVDTKVLRESVPPESVLDDLAITAGDEAVTRVENLLVKYGVIDEPAAVERFLSGSTRGKPNQITPLNVANHEAFRKSLNQVDDPTGALSQIIAPVKRTLDTEVKFIDDAMKQAGAPTESIQGLREARGLVRDIKTTFSPQSAAGRILEVKRDGFTPVVETSKVFSEVTGANKAIEPLERLFQVFDRAGAKGARAKADFRAKAVAELLDGAFSSKSRTLEGSQLISRGGFDQALKRIGRDKLEVLFKDDPASLKKLDDISKTLDEITPSGFEIPKGSGSIILDVLERSGVGLLSGKLPMLNGALTTLKEVARKGNDAKVIKQALTGKPAAKKLAIKRLNSVKQQMPNLYAILSIGAIIGEVEQSEDKEAN